MINRIVFGNLITLEWLYIMCKDEGSIFNTTKLDIKGEKRGIEKKEGMNKK